MWLSKHKYHVFYNSYFQLNQYIYVLDSEYIFFYLTSSFYDENIVFIENPLWIDKKSITYILFVLALYKFSCLNNCFLSSYISYTIKVIEIS